MENFVGLGGEFQSLVQYVLHMGILVIMGRPIETSWGPRPLGYIYALSCGTGAILCIVSNMKEEVVGEDTSEESIAISGWLALG